MTSELIWIAAGFVLGVFLTWLFAWRSKLENSTEMAILKERLEERDRDIQHLLEAERHVQEDLQSRIDEVLSLRERLAALDARLMGQQKAETDETVM